jgi:2-polyprenyl-3-methyl-5-hydroxy-6-metoxy-1,4-benzoquinol methylase
MNGSELNHVRCNLCGQDDAELLIHKDPSPVVRCRECGLVYRNPRVSVAAEVSQYEEAVYSEDYIANWSNLRRFDEQLEKIEQYAQRGKLLDIGCQFGAFLKMATNAGWETQGVDPSVQTYEIGKKLGLRIFRGTLKEANFPSGSYDVATMLLVLDQIPDPKAELFEVRRVIKKNGFLFIRVPNVSCHLFAHRVVRVLEKLSLVRTDPTVFHIYGFSADTLRRLLLETGYRVHQIKNSKPSKADPYRADTPLRGAGVGLAKTGAHALAQLLYTTSLGKLYMGSSIEAVAQIP